MFGYVQLDFKIPEHLRKQFAIFPVIFKSTIAGRQDDVQFLQGYAEKECLIPQQQRMVISSVALSNDTLTTPVPLFHLELGLVWTKTYGFVEYTPVKCSNNFVQSAANARRQEDEKPNAKVVAETIKLLGNSSCGYQKMNHSRQLITRQMTDKKTYEAINKEIFKILEHINDRLYQVELATSAIKHKETVIVGFFILQSTKLRMLDLYY